MSRDVYILTQIIETWKEFQTLILINEQFDSPAKIPQKFSLWKLRMIFFGFHPKPMRKPFLCRSGTLCSISRNWKLPLIITSLLRRYTGRLQLFMLHLIPELIWCKMDMSFFFSYVIFLCYTMDFRNETFMNTKLSFET